MINVPNRVKQLKLNHVFNIWERTSPDYMRDYFNKISDTELNKCTRASKNNFFLPRVSGIGTNTFSFRVPKIGIHYQQILNKSKIRILLRIESKLIL